MLDRRACSIGHKTKSEIKAQFVGAPIDIIAAPRPDFDRSPLGQQGATAKPGPSSQLPPIDCSPREASSGGIEVVVTGEHGRQRHSAASRIHTVNFHSSPIKV